MPPEPLAMFPLATVVFPTTVLPLHVFERRYRRLAHDVLADTGEFGICLIARGAEVGGGDERVSVGTRVRVELATPLDGERWILVARGVDRVRVDRWLDDDPYPRAMVETLPPEGPAPPPSAVDAARGAVTALRRLQSECVDGWTAPCVDVPIDDPAAAPWTLCAMSPLSLVDLQALLEVPDDVTRLALLRSLCDARRQDLEAVLRLDAAR